MSTIREALVPATSHRAHAAVITAALAFAACATPAGSAPPSAADAIDVPSVSIGSKPSSAAITDGEPWLLYQAWGPGDVTHLGLVRPDGSDDHRLEIAGLPSDEIAHPDWSPDGTQIAFDVWGVDPDMPGQRRVEPWIADADGTDATLLASCELPCLQLAFPTWSPDATQVAMLRYDILPDATWGVTALEVLDLSTGARRVVTQTDDGTSTYQRPRWSPDGSAILFAVETFTDTTETTLTGLSLGTASTSGSGENAVTILTPPEVLARDPDWDLTGKRLVFTRPPSLPVDMSQSNHVDHGGRRHRPAATDHLRERRRGGTAVLGSRRIPDLVPCDRPQHQRSHHRVDPP